MKSSTKYAVGLMSGTSMDGLDLILASFSETSGQWGFSILKAVTIPYPATWKKKLLAAPGMPGDELMLLHKSYGRYLGDRVNEFLRDISIRPQVVASHGHTVFHQPHKGITFQLGDGNEIAARSGLPVVFDFRSLDVALGGQGAPLVPVGDRLLFPEYAYCLNLGGFANISFEKDHKMMAWDPCPANLAVHHIMQPEGKDFDRDGATGRQGKINKPLLECLNNLEYYRLPPPKSLGREWLETTFFPCLDRHDIPPADKLRTVYEHIALQICRSGNPGSSDKILVTGGGAHNIFLIELLKEKCAALIEVPDKVIIDFKEALIFAFLGLLRLGGKTNCLASVTGAKQDSSSGTLVII